MCTAIVRYEPGSEWPLLVAFVRDEDRGRETDPPGFWWPDHPGMFGGRDTRAGGTWLAVGLRTARLAFVQNQIGPHVSFPDESASPSRGQLPLHALAQPQLDLRDLDSLERYQPFHLLTCGRYEPPRWWQWSGTTLEQVTLQPGIHLVASRGLGLAGERERRATQLERFAAAASPRPEPGLAPADAWSEWLSLLDGRDAQPGDFGGLVVHSVPERPGFGTVGATLVAIASDGRVRYDVNAATDLMPDAWAPADLAAAGASAR